MEEYDAIYGHIYRTLIIMLLYLVIKYMNYKGEAKMGGAEVLTLIGIILTGVITLVIDIRKSSKDTKSLSRDHADLQKDLHKDHADLKKDLHKDHADLQKDLHKDHADLQKDLHKNHVNLQKQHENILNFQKETQDNILKAAKDTENRLMENQRDIRSKLDHVSEYVAETKTLQQYVKNDKGVDLGYLFAEIQKLASDSGAYAAMLDQAQKEIRNLELRNRELVGQNKYLIDRIEELESDIAWYKEQIQNEYNVDTMPPKDSNDIQEDEWDSSLEDLSR